MKEIVIVVMVGALSVGCWQVLDFCRDPLHAWNHENDRLQRIWNQEAAKLYALQHSEDAGSEDWMSQTLEDQGDTDGNSAVR